MDDMYDDPQTESEIEEISRRRWSVTWKSCLLLGAMLLGVLATPIAVFYHFYSTQSEPLQQLIAIDKELKGRGRIAYINNDFQLATIAPDGSDGRQLTNLNRRFEFPAWAPDGSRLAVLAGDSLYLVEDQNDPEDESLHLLYQSADQSPFYFYWSPDSSQVSFLANHPESIALHLVGADTLAEDERLLAVGQPFYWDWTPDGDRLFIHTGLTGPDARLGMLEPDTALKNGDNIGENIAEPGLFQAPGISPSGRYQAFAGLDSDGDSQLVIQNIEGENQVTMPHLGQLALTWSPAADLLAYTSPSLDSVVSYGPLRVLDPTTGESRTMTQSNVIAFFWSPDGQTIAYLTLPRQDDDSIQAASFTTETRSGSDVNAQPEGIKLDVWMVNVESGFQRRLTTFVPSSVFAQQFLPFFDQYALSHRLWSPASESILLPMVESGVSHIALVDAATGGIQILAAGEIGFWSHQ